MHSLELPVLNTQLSAIQSHDDPGQVVLDAPKLVKSLVRFAAQKGVAVVSSQQSLPSVGPGADPGVQAVSPSSQVT